MQTLRFTGSATREEFEAAARRQPAWYHSYYFDNGFEVRGDYDIGRDIASYGFPEDLKGKKVLDIGTGGGWFAIWFEQQGAEVTTVDVRGTCDYDTFGWFEHPPIESEKARPDRIGPNGEPIYHSQASGGFWVMKDLLGSNVRFVNSRVYEIRPELFGGEKFDLVFIGALLLHLSHPIGALRAARSVCKDRCIATTTIVSEPEGEESPHPTMELPYTHLDPISWWRPNKACYRKWFLAAGFPQADVSRTLMLTSDVPQRHPRSGEIGNPTQILQIGDARVTAAPRPAGGDGPAAAPPPKPPAPSKRADEANREAFAEKDRFILEQEEKIRRLQKTVADRDRAIEEVTRSRAFKLARALGRPFRGLRGPSRAKDGPPG